MFFLLLLCVLLRISLADSMALQAIRDAYDKNSDDEDEAMEILLLPSEAETPKPSMTGVFGVHRDKKKDDVVLKTKAAKRVSFLFGDNAIA
jgi:hypothetical protein